MAAGIYKIINDINNKIYIGSTQDFSVRWKRHCAINSKCVKLRNAIQKYGSEHFQLVILEHIDVANETRKRAHELLMEREQEYLNNIQPFDDNGYNIQRTSNGSYGTPHTEEYKKSISGGNNPKAKSVIQYSITGEYIREYGCIQEAAKQNQPASVKRIVECCTGRAITTGNSMWCYAGDSRPLPRTRFRGVSVIQLCKHTKKIITTFPSIKKAAKAVGCWESDIVSVCKKLPHKHTAGGYGWQYAT